MTSGVPPEDTAETSPVGGVLVYEYVRSRILRRELTGGAPVAETELAAAFRTSRAAVDEAVRQLAAEGLVDRCAEGARVRELPDEDVLPLHEVRSALERAVVRAGARRRTPLDLVPLRRTLRAMRDLADSDVASRLSRAHAFGNALRRTAHHPQLMRSAEQAHVRMGPLPSLLHDDAQWTKCCAAATALVDAIEAGDAAAAGRISEQHSADVRATWAAWFAGTAVGDDGGPRPGRSDPRIS